MALGRRQWQSNEQGGAISNVRFDTQLKGSQTEQQIERNQDIKARTCHHIPVRCILGAHPGPMEANVPDGMSQPTQGQKAWSAIGSAPGERTVEGKPGNLNPQPDRRCFPPECKPNVNSGRPGEADGQHGSGALWSEKARHEEENDTRAEPEEDLENGRLGRHP